MNTNCLSVSGLNTLLKTLIETDVLFQDIWVIGEISNLRHYAKGGQLYFNLADRDSVVNCMVFDSFLKNLTFVPENGVEVMARGKVKVFQRKGTYCLQVAYMMLKGKGKESDALAQLKAKLHAEGLFAPGRKKPIPKFPKSVALITAWDSAAMWDFCRISRSQHPWFSITVIPATMQGADCPGSVVAALRKARSIGEFDVCVLMRGGGSSEDLGGFNAEAVVRAISELDTPLITAIGHEIDVTLADFAADLRAPTPTAAAHLLAAPFLELQSFLVRALQVSRSAVEDRVHLLSETVYDILPRVSRQVRRSYARASEKISLYRQRVISLNPLRKYEQGFSISRLASSGHLLKSIHQVKPGDEVVTELIDGHVYSVVKLSYETRKNSPGS